MSATAKASPVAQPLDLLALDLKAKMAGYRHALAWWNSAPTLEDGSKERCAVARAELGRAAAALAQWCGEDVPTTQEPESHGARRTRVAESLLDQARRRVVELSKASECVACGGTGRKPGFDLDPCLPCGGTGRT